MRNRSHNTQMFALRDPPPARCRIGGADYRLVRVFKHDFYAATCLYERREAGGGAPARIVVKLGRTQPFCGIPLDWLGRAVRDREEAAYRVLAGIRGVPRWGGRIGPTGCFVEYIDARPLDHLVEVPPGFFDRLRRLLDEVHGRGVAYGDSNKRSNILADADGQPYLVDYQIALRRRDDLPRPIRVLVGRVVDYMIGRDLYHLYKHKRRLAPGELTAAEEAISRHHPLLHKLHRKIAKAYRACRRALLRQQHRAGRLVSPTAELEDHHQPEKATWRDG